MTGRRCGGLLARDRLGERRRGRGEWWFGDVCERADGGDVGCDRDGDEWRQRLFIRALFVDRRCSSTVSIHLNAIADTPYLWAKRSLGTTTTVVPFQEWGRLMRSYTSIQRSRVE